MTVPINVICRTEPLGYKSKTVARVLQKYLIYTHNTIHQKDSLVGWIANWTYATGILVPHGADISRFQAEVGNPFCGLLLTTLNEPRDLPDCDRFAYKPVRNRSVKRADGYLRHGV